MTLSWLLSFALLFCESSGKLYNRSFTANTYENYGTGNFTTFIRTEEGTDVPTEVGVRIPDFDVFMNLPENDLSFTTVPGDFWWPEDYPGLDLIPFKFIEINYLSDGHVAGVSEEGLAEIYTWDSADIDYYFFNGSAYHIPHWDVQFFTMTEAETAEIQCMSFPPCEMDEEMAAMFYHPPASWEVPEGFFMDYVSVGPGWGINWHPPYVPQSQSEYAHEPAFMLGSYDGVLNMYEPMVASTNLRDVKESGEVVYRAIAQPEGHRESGYYPTGYQFYYDAYEQEYIVSLVGLEYREAATSSISTADRLTDLDVRLGVAKDHDNVWSDTLTFTAPDSFHSKNAWEVVIQHFPGSSDELLSLGVRLPNPFTRMEPVVPEGESLFADVGLPDSEVDTIFDHVQIEYNPVGHVGGISTNDLTYYNSLSPSEQTSYLEGSGVYYTEHWDIRFFFGEPTEVEDATCDSYPPCVADDGMIDMFLAVPRSGTLPESYFMDELSATPSAGVHWHPEYVTDRETLLQRPIVAYGSFDAKLTFLDIVVSAGALASAMSSAFPITVPVPALGRVAERGHYPRAVQLFYEASTDYFWIAISDMEMRRPGASLEERIAALEHSHRSRSSLDDWRPTLSTSSSTFDSTLTTFVQNEPGLTTEPLKVGISFVDFDAGGISLPVSTGEYGEYVVGDFELPEYEGNLPVRFIRVVYYPGGHVGGLSEEETDDMVWNSELANNAYMVPHFDFVFFLVDSSKLDTIQCSSYAPCSNAEAEAATFFKEPSTSGRLPDGFFLDSLSALPGTGVDWHPPHVPSYEEFLDQAVYKYGTYDGDVYYWKISISIESLRLIRESGRPYVDMVPQCDTPSTTVVPIHFEVSYDEESGLFDISLTDLISRSVLCFSSCDDDDDGTSDLEARMDALEAFILSFGVILVVAAAVSVLRAAYLYFASRETQLTPIPELKLTELTRNPRVQNLV